jgi:hypothetical protein
MQPLVLAIEPDHRQAAIVKRIVREKVLADVTVVDSRDAALDAMRTMIPDVLLLSTLLSPRDEDELIAHLRTLRDAEHLQTHTIPQLSSSIGVEDEKPKGLLSAFRRKKGPEPAPSGCDPDLFAEEIRAYLKRASDKKREMRETGSVTPVVAALSPAPASAAAAPAAKPSAAEVPAAVSAWSSPFEWRPTQSRTAPIDEPSPSSRVPDPPPPLEPFDEDLVSPIFDREPAAASPAFDEPEPVVAGAPAPVADWRSLIRDPEPTPAAAFTDTEAEREPEPAWRPEPTWEPGPLSVVLDAPPSAPRVRYPLTMRHARGWWYEEQERRNVGEPDLEMSAVLKSLAVPAMIAGVTYAEGCRIRRVRLGAES